MLTSMELEHINTLHLGLFGKALQESKTSGPETTLGIEYVTVTLESDE